MRPEIGMRTSLAMNQVLSPQMVLQMRLLALPILDFNQEIERAAEENPVIEVTNPSETAATDTKRERKEDQPSEEWDERLMQRIAELGEEPREGSGSWAGGSAARDEDWTDPILRLSPAKTLRDELLEQVHLGLSGIDERIGEYIVQDLSPRGFVERTPEEMAPDISVYTGETVTAEQVARVLEHLKQTLEPPGLGAANIDESIALQLRRRGQEQWIDLLVRGFALLREGKERELTRLCKRHKVDPGFVFDRLSELHFVPTFGVAEESFDTSGIRPEVTIVAAHPEVHGPGKYEIRYNNNAVAQVRLNPKIIELARNRDSLRPQERAFLRKKVSDARFLRQVIDERRNLLVRTTEALVAHQWRFLDRGMRYLQPLTQREIAEEVGRHETTISRLVHGRFAETPQGTVPLSAFFSQAVGDKSGAAAREALRELMDQEKEGTACTDDELAEQMRLRGFAIQRRTVNKYRRMLGGYYALKRSVRRAMTRSQIDAGEAS